MRLYRLALIGVLVGVVVLGSTIDRGRIAPDDPTIVELRESIAAVSVPDSVRAALVAGMLWRYGGMVSPGVLAHRDSVIAANAEIDSTNIADGGVGYGDLTGANAGDGEVLTYDSGSSAWGPAPSAGGGGVPDSAIVAASAYSAGRADSASTGNGVFDFDAFLNASGEIDTLGIDDAQWQTFVGNWGGDGTLGADINYAEFDAPTQEITDGDSIFWAAGAIAGNTLATLPFLMSTNSSAFTSEVNVAALSTSFFFRGDNAASRNITLGQQATFVDEVIIDVPSTSFTIDDTTFAAHMAAASGGGGGSTWPNPYPLSLMGNTVTWGSGESGYLANRVLAGVQIQVGDDTNNGFAAHVELPVWAFTPDQIDSIQVYVSLSLDNGDNEELMTWGLEEIVRGGASGTTGNIVGNYDMTDTLTVYGGETNSIWDTGPRASMTFANGGNWGTDTVAFWVGMQMTGADADDDEVFVTEFYCLIYWE